MFEGVYLLGEWNGVATARSHVVIRKLFPGLPEADQVR